MRRFTPLRHGRITHIAAGRLNRRLQYGGQWFRAASALPLTQRTTGSGIMAVARLVGAAVRRPWRILALGLMLARTPSEPLYLSDSAAGQALRAYFGRRFLGLIPVTRLCRGVLILPRRHSDYLRGRRREAVRRNLRRATAAGITCETINDRSRALEYLRELAEGRERPLPAAYVDRWRREVARPETTIVMARDADGRPVAIGSAVIDEMVGLIEFALASRHEARWALHDHIVQLLIAHGARYLLAEGDGPFGALGFSPAVQRYQHLHGYELRHLKPRAEATVAWSQTVLASLAAAAVAASVLMWTTG